MTATKFQPSSASAPTYHTVNSEGNHIALKPHPAATMEISLTDGSNSVRLSRQNVIDLLAPLTAFANTGMII
jgi:hypothetical protein